MRLIPGFQLSCSSRGRIVLAVLALTLATYCGLSVAQALPAASGPGSRLELGAGLSGFQQDYGRRVIEGTTFYADFNPQWRYGIEGEVRHLNHKTSQEVTQSSYMAGLKVAVRSHPSIVQPYVKMMVGTGHIVLPFRYAQGNFLIYAPGGGLDIALGDYLKVRLLDFEYQRWPDFPYGTLSPFGVTAGIAVRLNRLKRYPENHVNR